MANPRKFSEKIALHNQKQAEETAAFEEIMREVMGATRGPKVSYSNNANINSGSNNQQQQQQQHLHITPSFNATRAGSLPNVNQIDQHNSNHKDDSKDACIDLQSALINLQEIKNGCIERSNSVRIDNASRRHYTNHAQQKRSQSPYSTNSNAYLSPPPPDGHWRRTNSDSALHQSTLLSASTNQTSDEFHQMMGNTSTSLDIANNGSPRRTPAMVIDHSANSNLVFTCTNPNQINGNTAAWDVSKDLLNTSDKFLLSASLPDQQLRPRSCEVPGINIYPSQDDNHSSESLANHHHIPISSNTGSLPDLTNLHFPVPLPTPIDADDQNGVNGMQNIMKMTGDPNSPYSNGPDSPFSPTSSHNSNLSPPPPCNIMGNYAQSNSQPSRRQGSPGPSPSPTASRRRAHHNVNNMIMGHHRHQQSHQVQSQVCCYNQQDTPTHIPPHSPRAPSYLSETSHHYSYKSPPRITVEGLAMDTNALSLNGNGAQYKSIKNTNSNSSSNNNSTNSNASTLTNTSVTSPFQQQQFQFNNTPPFQNFSMSMHRSTTPTDSCSAPTSPASQNISPSNSPELPINCNGANGVSSNQQFSNSYSSYSNQQANILQHQLEQFRMTNESDAGNYMMPCSTSLTSPSNDQNQNVFYLDNNSISNVNLNQYAESVISQQNNNDLPSSPHQISTQSGVFSNESIYYQSSQLPSLNNMPNNSSNIYMKSELTTGNLNNFYNNQQHSQLSNSSHCTTPQTPTSIPDIILTGPNNLDELQSTNDFVKDLNNTIVNMSNMSSFDSDIFCSASEELRTGPFDSFDLDSLQILPDIDSNTE